MPVRPSAAHNCYNALYFQHSNTLRPLDANIDVAGKQWKIQGDPRNLLKKARVSATVMQADSSNIHAWR
jgi:UDP-N-acetylglucosamine enolpyruvyl transferase